MNVKVSIITCAREAGDSESLSRSVVGCLSPEKYEVLEQVGYTSIGRAYNEGAACAKGDVFVFTHTDVTLWCNRVLFAQMLDAVMRPETGFVGVAGTRYLNKTGIWWQTSKDHLAGAVTHTHGGKTYTSAFGPFGPCVVMDGVWLACKRSLIEDLFGWVPHEGFHYYDIEMTLRAHLAGKRNMVVPLPLLHGSIGELSPEWYAARDRFLLQYGDKLPIQVGE